MAPQVLRRGTNFFLAGDVSTEITDQQVVLPADLLARDSLDFSQILGEGFTKEHIVNPSPSFGTMKAYELKVSVGQ